MIIPARGLLRLHRPARLAVLAWTALFLPLSPSWGRQERPPAPEAPLPPPDITRRATPLTDHGLKQQEGSARFEREARDVLAPLMREPEPVRKEMRKALASVVEQLYKSLGDNDFSHEAMLDAFDRAADEPRGSAGDGGPAERRAREAWDQARNALRELINRRDQEQDDLGVAAPRDDEAGRRPWPDRRDERPRDRGGELGQANRELREARRQIAELKRQLLESKRRLEMFERGGRPRAEPRDEARSRIVPLDRSVPSGNPVDLDPFDPPIVFKDQPEPPARPDQPTSSAGMMSSMMGGRTRGSPGFRPGADQPQGSAEVMAQRMSRMGGGSPPSDQDRRLRELETKMDRLIKELGDLKKSKSQAKD